MCSWVQVSSISQGSGTYGWFIQRPTPHEDLWLIQQTDWDIKQGKVSISAGRQKRKEGGSQTLHSLLIPLSLYAGIIQKRSRQARKRMNE